MNFSGVTGAYETLVTDNVIASSATGDIFGYFVAHVNLYLRNDAGTVGVYLIPRFQADIPMTLESIAAITVSEYPDVEMYVLGEPPRRAGM
jgi:hypothetical protein